MHIPRIKYVYLQSFMFVGSSVIEILEFNWKKEAEEQHGYSCNFNFYQIFFRFFSDIISFQHVLTLVLVEVKLSGN